ncbi:hypothetical protein AB84_1629 [Escherichia coli 2-052-05_S3_C1]|nr:hypothetical protein AB84_1628 [Escherichia coli 2-052-05_S3_C1]KDV80015.1 hypothetical protein AC42_3784 [Escherichia coli 2-052-05_S3_C3]KEN78522.1 hypothetical protein AC14_1639 [Escherichia coli 2-052-05_S3_C2]KDT20957.1 hypothetical protein AB84_1631 [Escherichia coli 2-052-05_S3_C1]KDT20965.1 hypothetical protein AB84_1627 [Escherichia coli 2-052-05_S3_C1]
MDLKGFHAASGMNKAYVVYNMKMTPFTAPFETDDKRNIA